MTIDPDAIAASQAAMAQSQSRNPFGSENSAKDSPFADAVAAKVEADNRAILARREANKHNEDIAFIRENGFRQYAEKVHEEKMEELRAKILEEMGLSEEDLQNMSPEHRKAIEDVIQREIETRMAANSIMNDGERADQSGENGLLAEAAGKTALDVGGAAELVGNVQGGGALGMMAVLEAQELRDAAIDPEDQS